MYMQFNVDNMTCGHCVKAVTNALQAADESAQVSVDLEQKTVTLETSLEANQVILILEDEGYPAQLKP